MKITIQGVEVEVSSLSVSITGDQMRCLMDDAEALVQALLANGGNGMIYPLHIPTRKLDEDKYCCNIEFRDPSAA